MGKCSDDTFHSGGEHCGRAFLNDAAQQGVAADELVGRPSAALWRSQLNAGTLGGRIVMDAHLRDLGEPDICIGGLSLWTHSRAFPDSTDRWDGNWLRTTAFCKYPGAKITVEGPLLRNEEIQAFGAQCASLHSTLVGEARLKCIEPYLGVVLTGNSRGHVSVEIALTPDQLQQRHEFRDGIDQSYLPAIVASCRKVLERFPVVGLGDENIRNPR